MKFSLVERPNSEQILQIFQDCKQTRFQKEEFLFQEGDSPKYLDLLISGKIQIFKYDSNFNEITLNFFTPISLIAEWAVINEVDYPASGRFTEESEVKRMPLSVFKLKLNESLLLNHLVMHSLNSKIQTLNMTINRGLTMDGYQRVLHYLYHSPEETLELKQTQIASMLCLRPETLSRILKQLKDQKLIEIEKGKILVRDKDHLRPLLKD
jgi:CRP-like cAMP-binding protein